MSLPLQEENEAHVDRYIVQGHFGKMMEHEESEYKDFSGVNTLCCFAHNVPNFTPKVLHPGDPSSVPGNSGHLIILDSGWMLRDES